MTPLTVLSRSGRPLGACPHSLQVWVVDQRKRGPRPSFRPLMLHCRADHQRQSDHEANGRRWS